MSLRVNGEDPEGVWPAQWLVFVVDHVFAGVRSTITDEGESRLDRKIAKPGQKLRPEFKRSRDT